MPRSITVTRNTFFSMLLAVCPLCGAGFKAGAVKVDITPPTGLPMYGYFDRTQLSKGTLDPLYARVLVLEVGGKRLALVTLDLGRVFGTASLAKLRAQLTRSSGISFLLITASHTHSGPNILDEYPSNRAPAWETACLDKIAHAVEEACEHLEEARLGTGYGEVTIGYNRRRVFPDGTVSMFWTNPDKVPTSPVDPTVSILRVDTVGGKPLAIVVNYACHPVVFGPDNLEYSADFVGVMARAVEERVGTATGSSPLCLFVQGGDGDINPYYATTPLGDGAVKKRDWTGEQLGQEAARVAETINTVAAEQPSLEFAEDPMTFPVRWDAQKFRQGMLAAYGERIYEDHADLLNAEHPRRELALPVTAVLINKTLALVGMPGEPFVDFQTDWRRRCPVRDAFFAGYTNGYLDYFPTIRAAAQGGYGAADSDTYVAVGAGERMLDHALIRIYEMLGQLADVPEDLKK